MSGDTSLASLQAVVAGACLLLACASAVAQPDVDPYRGLEFYYGDNHFHSGFSGDNTSDLPPIGAYLAAARRVDEIARAMNLHDDTQGDLGGYFLFLSDHIKYVPTRKDMTEAAYQAMRKQADDFRIDRKGPLVTFTAFAGGELTGLARGSRLDMPWDDKFGHLNIFNVTSISPFVESNLFWNQKGTTVMDIISGIPGAIGQFNHPGYGGEPRTGDSPDALYPYTPQRDRVFKFFEVTDGNPKDWDIGVAQYQLCLQNGYHVSPVAGSDIHDTQRALTLQTQKGILPGRTVIIAPPTLGKSIVERRKILLDAAEAGHVYATENPNLRLIFSINGFSIGHRFAERSELLKISISVRDPGSPGAGQRDATNVRTIDLVQNKPCSDHGRSIAKGDVTLESQCTKSIQRWSTLPSGTDILLADNLNSFHAIWTLKSHDRDMHYLFLQVTQQDGSRAITTPFFFD
jgi:hypothetical protein